MEMNYEEDEPFSLFNSSICDYDDKILDLRATLERVTK